MSILNVGYKAGRYVEDTAIRAEVGSDGWNGVTVDIVKYEVVEGEEDIALETIVSVPVDNRVLAQAIVKRIEKDLLKAARSGGLVTYAETIGLHDLRAMRDEVKSSERYMRIVEVE